MKVLLVEDEYIISMLTEDMLIELGYQVCEIAATLEQGLHYAKTATFDYAVLDINLNGAMSYPIADVLIERSIPFIFASGYAPNGIEISYPGVSKLQKPFTINGLRQALDNSSATD